MSEPPSSGGPKPTGYIPGDDAWTRWRNWFSILAGKMDQEGLEQYVRARDVRMEEADCKRCEKQRDYLLQYSKLIGGLIGGWKECCAELC